MVSYHTDGNYSADPNYFATAHTNGDLTALASGTSGGDGVYAYGTGQIFPTDTYNASNYWVDVVFNGAATPPPVATNDSGFATTENTPVHHPAAFASRQRYECEWFPVIGHGGEQPYQRYG